MLYYNKLYDILTGKHGLGGRSMKCSIKELYGIRDKLKYIYFATENDIPCLLHIADKHEMEMDARSKFLDLVEWEDNDIFGLNAVLAADNEFTVVKKIKPSSSPLGYIQFLNKLKPSLASIPYKVGIITEEFLVVLNDDGDIETYRVPGHRDTKMLVVMELESILKNFINEIERVYKNVCKLIKDDNTEHWTSLLELLQKCRDMKIIQKGRQQGTTTMIEEAVKLHVSRNAVKTALEYFQ